MRGADEDTRPTDGILVLGVGNILLGDEGAGIHAMRRLQAERRHGARVRFVDGGTLSFPLAAPIEDCGALLVLDAAEMQIAPGSVRVFEGAGMDSFLGSSRRRSVHEVGLIDLMAVAALAGRLPPRRALIGIQPEVVDWGDVPGTAVARAIPRACQRAIELMQRWQA